MPKLGQHFLISPEIADRIVAAARLNPGESVVEIGPGEGALTERLLSRGNPVTAIELDARLHDKLEKRFEETPKLKLIHADFLKLDLGELPAPSVFVANLPYAVAAPILQRILGWPGWKRAVLMFQKEVVERLLAEPGTRKYGLLTVSVAMKAQVEKICEAPKRFFRPPPRVDSAVVRFDPRTEPLLPPTLTEERYMSVARAAFAHRRKTVLNSLCQALKVPKDRIETALKDAGLDPGCRAEEISPEGFVSLAQGFSGDLI
jgi:16S rRNA (adenine1518-N6/adenine1519-N6)-dimethyltransferase